MLGRRVARWESRSRKHWVELSACSYGTVDTPFRGICWSYESPDAGGTVEATNDAEAIRAVQSKVDAGYFQPDANRTPMQRVR